MEINWNDYDQFLAECYEAEDEAFEKYCEDAVFDDWK